MNRANPNHRRIDRRFEVRLMKSISALASLSLAWITTLLAFATPPVPFQALGKDRRPLHLNFVEFKFYAQRPGPDSERAPAKLAPESPPADIVPFAGLSPQDACDKASLPPGFKMHVFAAEPDVRQPIAFCLDHRGRVWVAEGYTYPQRNGAPPKTEAPSEKPTAAQLKDIFGGADR